MGPEFSGDLHGPRIPDSCEKLSIVPMGVFRIFPVPPNWGSSSAETDREVRCPRFRREATFPAQVPRSPGMMWWRSSRSNPKSKVPSISPGSPRRSATLNLQETPAFAAFSRAIPIAVGELSAPVISNPFLASRMAEVPGAAPEVDGPAGPDSSAVHKGDEGLHRSLTCPKDPVEGYPRVNLIGIRALHPHSPSSLPAQDEE